MSISCASRRCSEAVASSLTELFAPDITQKRISGMLENYDFISDETLAYFKRRADPGAARRRLRARLCQAERPHARGAAAGRRRRCDFKCNVLWAQLDALHHAYVDPGMIPPGAFVPEGFMTELRR